MAASVFASFADRYRSLTGALTFFTFDAPDAVDAVQVYPNYGVLFDDGTTPDYEMELTVIETTQLRIMFYCDTLDNADAAVEIAKYNGGAINARLGLDFGTLPTLDTDYTNLEVRRMLERRFLAQSTGKNAARVFGCEMHYRVTLWRNAA